uniref:ATP synthase subunit a n=1 Tax=Amphiuma means TaxID=8312 RepID=C9DHC6_AMPME|nr:ATP synthase F0 subunit 6 [Amphiuma means]
MSLSLFNQFMSPTLMGVPLLTLALLLPWILTQNPTNKWQSNRLSSLQSWFCYTSTKQLMIPLKPKGHAWSLLFTSLMVFLMSMNLLGLLPYTFTPTTQLSMNLGLAIPLWLATVILGLRNQPTTSLGHLLPEGTPTPLIPMLVLIETISLMIRPIALGVRLTANLTAGHLLIQLVSMATLTMMMSIQMTSLLATMMLMLLTLLEIAVAMIQAYVFVLLLSLYLQENL